MFVLWSLPSNHTLIEYRHPIKNSDEVTPTSLKSNSPPAHHLSSFKHFSIGTSSDWHRLIFSHMFHTIDATVPKAYIYSFPEVTYLHNRFSAVLALFCPTRNLVSPTALGWNLWFDLSFVRGAGFDVQMVQCLYGYAGGCVHWRFIFTKRIHTLCVSHTQSLLTNLKSDSPSLDTHLWSRMI